MGAIFGSLAALSIGTSEMFGRRVSKQLGAVTISVVVQLVAAVTAAIGALTFVPSELILGDMVRGAVSGVGFGIGMSCYFAGLNRSSSAIVAPVVGTLSAVIPFTYSAVTGEPPSAVAVAGAAIAFVGLVVITSAPAAAAVVKRGLPWALLAGVGYGFGQIAIIETAEVSGAWPGVAQRGTAFVGARAARHRHPGGGGAASRPATRRVLLGYRLGNGDDIHPRGAARRCRPDNRHRVDVPRRERVLRVALLPRRHLANSGGRARRRIGGSGRGGGWIGIGRRHYDWRVKREAWIARPRSCVYQRRRARPADPGRSRSRRSR